MGGGECPNCGQYTNASTSRLVRDACGHKKCRMCLVDEEEGCKACQSEHRIQMIGSFDYPVPSSPLVSLSVDSSASNAGSDKEEIVLQPLELVINKTLDHDRVLFDEPESCGSENSACRLEWVDGRDTDARNISQSQNVEGTTSCGMEMQGLNRSDCTDLMQQHVTPDSDFAAGLQKSVLPETCAPRIEPLELITNVRPAFESQGERQDVLVQSMEHSENNGEQINGVAKEQAQKPKGQKNFRLKRSHISVIPGIQETYKCNICCKTFKSATAQRYHDSCLTGIKPYQCTICERSFVKQSHFQYHERTHTGYKPFECSFCGKAFPQRNKLNRHLHSHQNEKRFKCSICKKGYSSRDDLKSHMNIHSGVTPYTCQICKKSFREAANLTRHMHTHSDERPHMCEQCGKSFKDKSLLVRHRRTHGKERPFSCSDCARVFLSKSELSRHSAVHSDDKPFPCVFCSTVFRRKDNLNRHTRHHHSEDRIAQTEKKSKKDEDDAQSLKAKPVSRPKQKLKPKEKPKCTSAVLPKSPAKISVLYLNSHEQINSRLDSRSNVIPVIRTTNELSNAVPVINGPISIKRPEETTNSPKKTLTHTEPIPLAEAVFINKRIEEKLYSKSNLNDDCYFRPDLRNRVDRQHTVHKIKPLRPNISNKTMSAGKIYSPERSFLEYRVSPAEKNNRTQSSLTRKYLSSENGNATPENGIATWNDCQETKGMNTPKHTVPKKRAIEELKSKPIVSDFASVFPQEAQSISCALEPERANCVPTITKTGHTNSANDSKEFNFPAAVSHDNKMWNESRVSNVGNAEKSTSVKKLSDIHWRRRTSEILKPRIHGFNELEITDEMSDTNGRG